MSKKEILTEDIINLCKRFESEAREEVFNRLDMSIEHDLPFVLAERVFWYFSDHDDVYEEPDLDDICNVVEQDYLNKF